MKKILITLAALSLMTFAAAASANLIGLFADAQGTVCKANFPVYSQVDVHIIAQLSDIAGVTAVEFRIGGVPDPAGSAIISKYWDSPLVIGDPLGIGVSVAFSDPMAGPNVHIGRLNIFTINGSWPGSDSKWCAEATLDSGNLVVVDDAFNLIEVDGWCFVANCTVGGPYGNCQCGDQIATEDTNWGSVKALY